MFEGFFAFGGTEIANSTRTAAYVDHMLPNFGLDNCYDCGDMQHALGHEDYTSPLVDGADWFDADDVASQGFFGMYPLAVDGIDDAVRESTVTQLAGDGAVMSLPRQKGREIRVSGLLIGMDDAAVQYGLTWLRNALLGGVCQDSTSCTGDHLCYFSSCPPICEDSPDAHEDAPRIHNQRLCDEGLVSTIARACALPFERNLYQVTVIDGPHVVERYNTVCGSMIRIEFTMVAGVPWSYSTAAWVASSDEGQVSQIISEISCTAGSTSILRRNLAPNPVPMTAGGWIAAEPTAYTLSRDTTFSRLPGRTSAKATVTNPEALTNIAPNPAPTGTLAGWGYTLGSADPTVRTNLATNPRPGALGTGWTYSAGGALAGGNNYFPNPSAVDDLTGWNQVAWGPAPVVTRTNLVTNPRALATTPGGPPVLWRASPGDEGTFLGADPANPNAGATVRQTDLPPSSLYVDPSINFPVAVGDKISFQAEVRSDVAQVAGVLRLLVNSYAGAVLTDVVSTPRGVPVGQWTPMSVTATVATAPAGAYVRTLIDGQATTLGDGFSWRRTIVEIGPSIPLLGAYFDGSMTSTSGDVFFAWTGTANNSTSITGTGSFPSGTVAHSPTGGDYQYQQNSGVMALTWTSPVAPATEVDVVRFDPVPVTGAGSANNVYANVSARTNAANLTTNVLVKMLEKNPGGTVVQTKIASNMVMTPGVWRRGGTFLTPTAAGNSVEVHVFYTGIDTNNIPAGTVLELSNFTQGDAGSGTYWDGDTPNVDTAINYAWVGTPRASASTRTVAAPAGTSTLTPAGAGPAGLAGFYRRTVTVPETATNTAAYWQYLTPTAPAVTWAVGDRMTASVFVMSSYDRTLALRATVTGRSTTTTGAVTTVPANTWTRLSVTVAITSAGTGTINVQTNYPLAANEQSGTFDITQLLIERSASVLPYFDGAIPDTPVLDFSWTGTANASTSTLSNKPPTATTAVNAGTGPTGVAGFQRTTITVPKTGGYSGGYYQMTATSSPVYTSALWVRFSVPTSVRLVMQGLNTGDAVVISDDTPFQGVPANTWVRLGPLTITFPGLAAVRVWAQQDPTTVLPIGATMDVSQVRVAAGATLNSPTLGRVQYMGQATSTNVVALMPTVEYTASVYVATSRPANARVLLAFKDAAGATLTTVEGVWEPTTVSTWGRVSVTAIAPAGTAFGTVEGQANLFTEEGQIGDASWWGDVLLERASVALAYFDGSLPDTPSIDYGWTGTANNSISTLTRTIPLDPGPLLDPDCAVVPQAPRPPILDIACLDTPTAWRRFTAIVPEDVVPMWRDAVPIVKVATDDLAARQVRVRFYPNPFVVPVEALDPCDFCGEFVISYIPPNSIMTIDGIRQIATVSGPTGIVQIASHLLYASDGGPMVWPQLTCGIAYTATLDVSPEGVTGLSAEICAAARE